MKYEYKTKGGVCAKSVQFELKDGLVYGVHFTGGCDGNLSAISKLAEGMPAERLIEVLSGNTCGPRATSCADQFAHALAEALKEATAK